MKKYNDFGCSTRWTERRKLAQELFPSASDVNAVGRLRRWLQSDPMLRKSLMLVGYKPRQRYLSPLAVQVLHLYFK